MKHFDPRVIIIIISLMLPRPLRYMDLSQSGECIGKSETRGRHSPPDPFAGPCSTSISERITTLQEASVTCPGRLHSRPVWWRSCHFCFREGPCFAGTESTGLETSRTSRRQCLNVSCNRTRRARFLWLYHLGLPGLISGD